MPTICDSLLERLLQRDATVAVIGLGYVGLPLALAFAEAGYRVVGVDVDTRKVASINAGVSYIDDISSPQLAGYVDGRDSLETTGTNGRDGDGVHRLPRNGRLLATADFSILDSCDAASICVPTPLNKTGEPDISYILSVTEKLAEHLHQGMVIVLESTTYPGTTTEVVLPRLEENPEGLKVGEDFFLAFSPERIDPGREDWTVATTPKVIGGTTPDCLRAARAYYGQAVGPLVDVSSPSAAEMVKLFENIFRSVNIGLANELLLICDRLGLDAWEILDAAATKPFGFMKFVPGPGLGGHCIPIDPHYLSWKLRTLDYNARFIELASEINTDMPRYWVQKVQDLLNEHSKALNGSRILILGVSYKKNISDLRESPALDIIGLLRQKGAKVEYHDPYVPSFDHDGLSMQSVEDLAAAVAAADCTVIVTDHDSYDWEWLAHNSQSWIDTRHVMSISQRESLRV